MPFFSRTRQAEIPSQLAGILMQILAVSKLGSSFLNMSTIPSWRRGTDGAVSHMELLLEIGISELTLGVLAGLFN